ncbi:MAG: hypothetical protein U0X91_27055 [Spirosomataceae bacterium]
MSYQTRDGRCRSPFCPNKMNTKTLFLLLFTLCKTSLCAHVWQWSVKVEGYKHPELNDSPTAFLWIPENCKKVKGVVWGMHNMIEEGILENARFRQTMSEIGFAAIWVTPGLDMVFDFNKGAGESFETMMKQLADVSGYRELAAVPVVPIGHSAHASFPWNFGAWSPNRTLAIISIKGDSPLTPLTGSGKPNPDWGNRTVEGIPSLFIMSEIEWWEDRIQPGFNYVQKYPNTPITFFADAGHGHFDYNQLLVDYIALFIKKAAKYRLSPNGLRFIHPKDGWLTDRWRPNALPMASSALYPHYKGDKNAASWCFDKEMATYTEAYYATPRQKTNQYIGFIQNADTLQPSKSHGQYSLKFKPLDDGITFQLKPFFSDTSKIKSAAQFAQTALSIDRICGPVKKINDTTFQLSFYRMGFDNPKRSNAIWLLAHNEGDYKFKSAVQQAEVKFPLKNTQGVAQKIVFEKLEDPTINTKSISLKAQSSAHLLVSFYVKEGPAYVVGNQLIFTKIPPNAKSPVKITVVAWQYGMVGKVQSAEPVERSFFIETPR